MLVRIKYSQVFMRKSKLKNLWCLALTFFLLLMSLMTPVMADEDASSHELSIENAPIEVIQKIDGSYPSDDGKFTYVLSAKTETAPLPENGNQLVLDGNNTGQFTLNFTGKEDEEIFEYEVSQEKNANQYFSWDQTVYRVRFQVKKHADGSAYVVRLIDHGELSSKDPEIVFKNTYTPPVVTEPSTNVFTGILTESNLKLLASVLMGTAVLIALVLSRKRITGK